MAERTIAARKSDQQICMTSEEWNRLFDLFHAAREKSGDERVMVLDAACGESTLLRRAVEAQRSGEAVPAGSDGVED